MPQVGTCAVVCMPVYIRTCMNVCMCVFPSINIIYSNNTPDRRQSKTLLLSTNVDQISLKT